MDKGKEIWLKTSNKIFYKINNKLHDKNWNKFSREIWKQMYFKIENNICETFDKIINRNRRYLNG